MDTVADNALINTVFLDLDGTFADTAPDLASSLNDLRIEHAMQPLPYEQIRPVVSHGGNALIQLAFDIQPEEPRFAELRARFLTIYNQRLHVDSQLFPGMETVIDQLETNNLRWGIITNKPAWLTNPLLEKIGLLSRPSCVVCGDTTDHRKPHPAPMWHALKATGSEPESSVYVGDAERDIAAGRAANMYTLAALYGYIGADEDPAGWQADGMVNSPGEILDWLEQFNHS